MHGYQRMSERICGKLSTIQRKSRVHGYQRMSERICGKLSDNTEEKSCARVSENE